MKVVSTFAGCGGSSLGYEQAGCEVVAAIEWDAHAVECYRANHPSTRIFHQDIATISGADILNATGLDVGELDILDGSPPCQGFSTAGRRVLDDPRNALFQQHLRLVDELKPRHVVIENVAGLIRGKMRIVAGEIFQALESRGYRVAAGLMRSIYFGVAQTRPRVFFVGSRVGVPALPRPISRPMSAGLALQSIEPDEVPPTTGARNRYLLARLRPGERGYDLFARLNIGRESAFSIFMLDPRKPSRTLIKTPGDQYHWDRRLLSVREALVLTGFPADYDLPGTYSQRWMRVGNSVAPPMTREIVRQSLRPL